MLACRPETARFLEEVEYFATKAQRIARWRGDDIWTIRQLRDAWNESLGDMQPETNPAIAAFLAQIFYWSEGRNYGHTRFEGDTPISLPDFRAWLRKQLTALNENDPGAKPLFSGRGKRVLKPRV
jgi:hypothetical protein